MSAGLMLVDPKRRLTGPYNPIPQAIFPSVFFISGSYGSVLLCPYHLSGSFFIFKPLSALTGIYPIFVPDHSTVTEIESSLMFSEDKSRGVAGAGMREAPGHE